MKITVGLILVAAIVAFYAPARLAALRLLGRSVVCPFAEAIKSDRNLKTQIHLKDRILKASRLVEADPRGFHLWDTPAGRFWIPEGSDYVLPFNLAEQERKIYGTGERFVKAGDIVLDCGANVGVFVRECLKAGAKKIIAIEPAPENLECLRRNFAPEIAAGRVVIYPKGVWDKEDLLTLNVDAHNSAADSFVLHPQAAQPTSMKLPLTTIDKLVAELQLETVNFIKMDIEGAEPRALAGARATLAKHHPRLSISAYHQPGDPIAVPQVIRNAWPDVQMECGPCGVANGRIRPDILYFH
ncbi:MAG TPA: FkbM family methyltransferase [Bryobacteraceae bacterium]|nr:FkbM family methyltransferase [Bryobacteraceae bacterium]